MMKYVFLLLCAAFYVGAAPVEDDLKCNLKICGSELLNFEHFSLSGMFRKMELASFCVKNCTPPVVHEFFQSIIFAVTRRVPGHCHGPVECREKNRFVALAQCVNEKAWPLLQCSKRLIDLGQIALEDFGHKQKRNFTCSIVVDTTQCIEEILQECGSQPFSLVKEIVGDVIKLGISSYCPSSHRNDFFVDDPTTALPPYQDRMKYFTDITPQPGPQPYPQFVKAYNPNAASYTQEISSFVVLSSLVASTVYMYHHH